MKKYIGLFNDSLERYLRDKGDRLNCSIAIVPLPRGSS